MAYLTSFGLYNVMYVANPPLPFAAVPLRASAILSILPTVYCVTLAILTDVHVLRGTQLKGTDRLVDGASVAIVVVLSQFVVVQLITHFIAPVIGLPPFSAYVPAGASERLPAWLNSMISAVSSLELIAPFACVGFAIGASVPVTAARALIRGLRVRSDGLPKLPALPNLEGKPPPRAVVKLR